MTSFLVPILLLTLCATVLAVGMVAAGQLLGPKRRTAVKQMPYESGMDPLHDARRRFDFRFHAVAIAFLIFDVELLFLYPWAVANKHPQGFGSVATPAVTIPGSPTLVFVEVMVFVGLLTLGYVYAWRRGIFRWR
ncbi:MAG: NADH-quinone oxidoreductase subunit A [Pirellulaceae bacterium]